MLPIAHRCSIDISLVFKMCSDVQRCFQVLLDVPYMFSRILDVLRMFSRCFRDFSIMFQEVLIISDPQVFSNEKIVFDDPKEYHDPWVSDVLTVISNEGMDSNDPKEFDDPQIFDDPISIGSMVGFDNSKACTVIPPSSMVLFWMQWTLKSYQYQLSSLQQFLGRYSSIQINYKLI